jgi:hypothetical protein
MTTMVNQLEHYRYPQICMNVVKFRMDMSKVDELLIDLQVCVCGCVWVCVWVGVCVCVCVCVGVWVCGCVCVCTPSSPSPSTTTTTIADNVFLLPLPPSSTVGSRDGEEGAFRPGTIRGASIAAARHVRGAGAGIVLFLRLCVCVCVFYPLWARVFVRFLLSAFKPRGPHRVRHCRAADVRRSGNGSRNRTASE